MQCGGVYPNLQLLLHLCGEEHWETARLRGEIPVDPAAGFVHLSTQAQVHLPANRLFAGRTDLLLLFVDPERLESPVRWEPGVPEDPAAMLFPHLYGPLPAAAVVAVQPYRPGADGVFPPLIHS